MDQMNVVLERNTSNLEGANNKLNVKEVTWECPKHKIGRSKNRRKGNESGGQESGCRWTSILDILKPLTR